MINCFLHIQYFSLAELSILAQIFYFISANSDAASVVVVFPSCSKNYMRITGPNHIFRIFLINIGILPLSRALKALMLRPGRSHLIN